MVTRMNVITIDPGLGGTGYCIWDKDWNLLSAGIVTSKTKAIKSATQEIKTSEMCSYVTKIAQQNQAVKGFIEYPRKFGGAGGNMVANRGDLVKLSTFVGFLAGSLSSVGITPEYVDVLTWKGQLPKDVVNRRITKLLSKKELSLLSPKRSHDWDACGIGLFMQGVF